MTPFARGYWYGQSEFTSDRIFRRINKLDNRRYAQLVQLGAKWAKEDKENPGRILTEEESSKLFKLLNEQPELELMDMARLISDRVK